MQTSRRSKRRTNSTTDGFCKTREAHAGELAEDYVEMIDDLIVEFGEARVVDIAQRLGVSQVTANKAIARMQRHGLVVKRPYRSIFLTDEGKQLAIEARRRHAILFKFLRQIGVAERQARIDAEGIEHHISETTLRAMSRIMRSARL